MKTQGAVFIQNHKYEINKVETARLTRNIVQFTDFSKFVQLEYFGNILGLFMNHQLFCGKKKAKK